MEDATPVGNPAQDRPVLLRLSAWARAALAVISASALAMAVLLTLMVMRTPQTSLLRWGDGDYAVLLTNGQVYYGKLLSADADFLVMEKVFYLRQRGSDAEKKEFTLVRRGAELHRPTKMYISSRQVQFMEPVSAESDLAKLIAKVK